jgi:hypothetical protein
MLDPHLIFPHQIAQDQIPAVAIFGPILAVRNPAFVQFFGDFEMWVKYSFRSPFGNLRGGSDQLSDL